MKPEEITNKTWSYRPEKWWHEGQANYILQECKKNNISVCYYFDKIFVLSKKKAPVFMTLVNKSFTYSRQDYLKENFTLPKKYYVDKSFLALYIKKNGETFCYTLEKNFKKLMYYIFIRRLSKVNHYKIFSTQRELKQNLDMEN